MLLSGCRPFLWQFLKVSIYQSSWCLHFQKLAICEYIKVLFIGRSCGIRKSYCSSLIDLLFFIFGLCMVAEVQDRVKWIQIHFLRTALMQTATFEYVFKSWMCYLKRSTSKRGSSSHCAAIFVLSQLNTNYDHVMLLTWIMVLVLVMLLTRSVLVISVGIRAPRDKYTQDPIFQPHKSK